MSDHRRENPERGPRPSPVPADRRLVPSHDDAGDEASLADDPMFLAHMERVDNSLQSNPFDDAGFLVDLEQLDRGVTDNAAANVHRQRRPPLEAMLAHPSGPRQARHTTVDEVEGWRIAIVIVVALSLGAGAAALVFHEKFSQVINQFGWR